MTPPLAAVLNAFRDSGFRAARDVWATLVPLLEHHLATLPAPASR
ncbi:hypothetical protein [Mycolicibacterium flavescens]|nr:hypothetical protein [Mycolicibacterium flavescens]